MKKGLLAAVVGLSFLSGVAMTASATTLSSCQHRGDADCGDLVAAQAKLSIAQANLQQAGAQLAAYAKANPKQSPVAYASVGNFIGTALQIVNKAVGQLTVTLAAL